MLGMTDARHNFILGIIQDVVEVDFTEGLACLYCLGVLNAHSYLLNYITRCCWHIWYCWRAKRCKGPGQVAARLGTAGEPSGGKRGLCFDSGETRVR